MLVLTVLDKPLLASNKVVIRVLILVQIQEKSDYFKTVIGINKLSTI